MKSILSILAASFIINITLAHHSHAMRPLAALPIGLAAAGVFAGQPRASFFRKPFTAYTFPAWKPQKNDFLSPVAKAKDRVKPIRPATSKK